MRSRRSEAVSGRGVPSSAMVRFNNRSTLLTAASLRARAARSVHRSERGDELLDPLVAGLERVLAQHRALGLVVELEVHPVDRVIPLALLRPADELAPQTGPGRLRRGVHGDVDVVVVADPLDQTALLHLVEEP